ncbi:MAG: hypothetical protein A3C61_03645 [Candidatus Yanofskybacteria bacterium RIFCSPHIGHO2_02_FULL_39_10]|uniref:bAvd-like domain-containing protein n=1 Tax=Candidatus Yanofskybacteria bacterium RIFCSPHIGHO2_02_FULL_39_10 TaxID=1802674 RepID=A0A1F8F7Z8_9BACT|nr:MAG: hypothetical protein A3C61_03645 [Candidatus Yanofskybacteria bacterium RIFCSPHIGHO2_02_FULL_39_10]
MIDELDIPIFKKSYELYKTFYGYRNNVLRQDRYTLWQKTENLILEIIEDIFLASFISKSDKLPVLERTSIKLNSLKVFIRLLKELKILDNSKYLILQEAIDEIGRMLGGWIKSTRAS